MKKCFASSLFLLVLLFNLTGCSTLGSKSGSLSSIYAATAVLAFLLLVGCIIFVRQKKAWFITLFTSVFIVNVGYTFLAYSNSLEMALWANRVSYLGSVFLPLSMLMIILNITNVSYKKYLPKILIVIAILIFLITASPGILPIYYKEVSFAVVHGVSTLVKVYGPLHTLYLLYLLGYFASMVAIIIRFHKTKSTDITAHAIFITIAVFVNICVWFAEQLVQIEFEFLSVSYLISELFLLGVHMIMNESRRLNELLHQIQGVQDYSIEKKDIPEVLSENTIAPDRIEIFINGLSTLTATEKAIYEAHLARVTSKEIMAQMNIKESTLKFHNRNLYGKLGVSTRNELLEFYKHIKATKENLSSR